MFLLCFAEHYLLTRNAGSICLYSVYISLLLAINIPEFRRAKKFDF